MSSKHEQIRPERFTRFYEEQHPAALRMLRANGSTEAEAREILDYCFEQAWTRFDEYLANPEDEYWFRRIVSNRQRNQRKKNSMRMTTSFDETMHTNREGAMRANPEQVVLERERVSYLEDAINSLSEKYESVVRLRLAGHSYPQLARVLGISTEAAESRMRRAAVKLAEPLRHFMEDHS